MIGQPGFAACAAPVACFLAFLPLELLFPSGFARQVMEITAQVFIASAVPLAWVSLIATRRWFPRAELDRPLGPSLRCLVDDFRPGPHDSDATSLLIAPASAGHSRNAMSEL